MDSGFQAREVGDKRKKKKIQIHVHIILRNFQRQIHKNYYSLIY